MWWLQTYALSRVASQETVPAKILLVNGGNQRFNVALHDMGRAEIRGVMCCARNSAPLTPEIR